MNTGNQYRESNCGTVEKVVTAVNRVSMPGILSRFVHASVRTSPEPAIPVELPDERLSQADRQRLMDKCLDECGAAYRNQQIDWVAADAINLAIGKANGRTELTRLLRAYKDAIVGNGSNNGDQSA